VKVELTVGVFVGDDFVDSVSYVVDSEPLARILSTVPEELVDFYVNIEGIKELYE
jgi:hypothetical protein